MRGRIAMQGQPHAGSIGIAGNSPPTAVQKLKALLNPPARAVRIRAPARDPPSHACLRPCASTRPRQVGTGRPQCTHAPGFPHPHAQCAHMRMRGGWRFRLMICNKIHLAVTGLGAELTGPLQYHARASLLVVLSKDTLRRLVLHIEVAVVARREVVIR